MSQISSRDSNPVYLDRKLSLYCSSQHCSSSSLTYFLQPLVQRRAGVDKHFPNLNFFSNFKGKPRFFPSPFQTFVFVAYNKVCTSQYFLWYLSLLPLVLPTLQLSKYDAITSLALWGFTQVTVQIKLELEPF